MKPRMHLMYLVGAGAMTAALAVAAPAEAKMMQATYTGVVGPMVDSGDFGGYGSYAWTGAPFTAVFIYDTALGSRTTTSLADVLSDNAAPWAIQSATLTIGTTTHQFATPTLPDYVGVAEIDDTGLPSYLHVVAETDTGIDYQLDLMGVASSPFPVDLDAPWSGPVGLGGVEFSNLASFDIIDSDPINGHDTSGYLLPQYLTIDEVPAGGGGPGGVPEPSSWMLLLAGFGGLGAALRARRREERQADALCA